MGNRGCACNHTNVQEELEYSKRVGNKPLDLLQNSTTTMQIEKPKKRRLLT